MSLCHQGQGCCQAGTASTECHCPCRAQGTHSSHSPARPRGHLSLGTLHSDCLSSPSAPPWAAVTGTPVGTAWLQHPKLSLEGGDSTLQSLTQSPSTDLSQEGDAGSSYTQPSSAYFTVFTRIYPSRAPVSPAQRFLPRKSTFLLLRCQTPQTGDGVVWSVHYGLRASLPCLKGLGRAAGGAASLCDPHTSLGHLPVPKPACPSHPTGTGDGSALGSHLQARANLFFLAAAPQSQPLIAA